MKDLALSGPGAHATQDAPPSEFYIPATESLSDTSTRTLKHADTFGIFDRYGDIVPGLGSPEGLFHDDTRYLSSLQLLVNGKRLNLNIEPRMTLLNALRNKADLTGNKRGCDRGVCGACTMIIDGRTAYSCSTLAIEVQGKQIRTVDGLADGSTLHPVQQAFCDRDALMCGFCTPGFVMATVALIEKHPNPTPAQVKAGLDGNICRCGTFTRIMEAATSVKGVARG